MSDSLIMEPGGTASRHGSLSRRRLGGLVGAVGAGLFLGGCTPARIPFGDFILSEIGLGGLVRKIHVFADGAALVVNYFGGRGGRVAPETMTRLRTLLESEEFRSSIPKLPTNRCPSSNTVTVEMGGTTWNLGCSSSRSRAFRDLEDALGGLTRAQFDGELPPSDPLPVIRVQARRWQTTPGPEIEIRPDGTVHGPSQGTDAENILPSELDALRLIITRVDLPQNAELPMPDTYRIMIGDRRPVFAPLPDPDGVDSLFPELSAIGIIAESAF
jgi:hypothetical protein